MLSVSLTPKVSPFQSSGRQYSADLPQTAGVHLWIGGGNGGTEWTNSDIIAEHNAKLPAGSPLRYSEGLVRNPQDARSCVGVL